MRLLIITQKIDEQDAVLGFMHGWIAEFASNTESVIAICLEKGQVNLSENVRVFSLGKEKNNFQFSPRQARSPEQSRGTIFNFQSIINFKIFKKIKYAWRFVRYIVQNRNEYDAVFAHMNPEYVVLGGLFWKLWGKTVTLWYAHKSVTPSLRLARFLTDIVFTSTASGFRLPSKKVRVVGQGIDTSRFKIQDSRFRNREEIFKIVTVGRIAPSKDYDTLIDAVDLLQKKSNLKISVDIIGPTSVASDEAYLKQLKEKIAQKDLAGIINFVGPVANASLPEVLASYDLFVNMGQTGSLDKAVPEAMACELPVLTCNEAFSEVLGPFTASLMYPKSDSEALAGKIREIVELSAEERKALGEKLRAIVVRDHSLQAFVRKIISAIESY